MKQATQALETASVQQHCRAARLPGVAANFVRLAEQAAKQNQSYVSYLEALLSVECEERDRHAVENRIREAQLPRVKTLEEFDFAQSPQVPAARIRELSEGGYIERSPAGCVDWRLRDGQDTSGYGLVPCRMPTKAAGTLHDGGWTGQ